MGFFFGLKIVITSVFSFVLRSFILDVWESVDCDEKCVAFSLEICIRQF